MCEWRCEGWLVACAKLLVPPSLLVVTYGPLMDSPSIPQCTQVCTTANFLPTFFSVVAGAVWPSISFVHCERCGKVWLYSGLTRLCVLMSPRWPGQGTTPQHPLVTTTQPDMFISHLNSSPLKSPPTGRRSSSAHVWAFVSLLHASNFFTIHHGVSSLTQYNLHS